MGKFISRRYLNLEFLGKEWKDCSVVFRSLSVKESRDLMTKKLQEQKPEAIMDITLALLQEHFIEGVGFDSEKNEITKLTKEDLIELPSPFLERATLFLVGGDISTGA